MDAKPCETMTEHEITGQQGGPPVKGNLRTSIYLKNGNNKTCNNKGVTNQTKYNEIIHKQACESGRQGEQSVARGVYKEAQMRLLPKLYIQDMPKEALGNNWSVN